jgi:hypothetical protein
MEAFVVGFENLEKKILCSILDVEVCELTDFSWKLSNINIKNGGLGLGDKMKMRFTAFHTSVMNFLGEAAKLFGQPALESKWATEAQAIFALLDEWDPQRAIDYQGEEKCLEKLANCEKLQSYLSSFYEKFNYKELLDSVKDSDKRRTAWLVSNHDKPEDSSVSNVNGLWLETNPKSRLHRMPNQNFAAALTLRLFMKRNNYRPNSACKGCKNKIADDEGCHFATGCNGFGSKRKSVHDMVRDTIDVMLRCNGVRTIKEDRQAFRTPTGASMKIPDISVYDFSSKTIVLDMRLTSPVQVTGTAEFVGKPLEPGRAAKISYRQKAGQYKGVVEIASGEIRLIPIVAEISGRFHEEALVFFKSVLERNSKRTGIPFHILWRYWMSALSLTLQNGVGYAIHTGSNITGKDVSPMDVQHLKMSNITGLECR